MKVRRGSLVIRGTNVLNGPRPAKGQPKPASGPPRPAAAFVIPPEPDEHQNWLADAACGGLGDAFIPDMQERQRTGPEGREELREQDRMAMRICESCPVRQLCARRGIETAHEITRLNGIWAGLQFTGAESKRSYIRKLEHLFEVMNDGEIQWEPSNSNPTVQQPPSESPLCETDTSGSNSPMTTLPLPPSTSGGRPAPLEASDTVSC
ncbi:transcriptional regulator WhiB-like [Gordonia phage Turuncu]|uniref:WhiB family transcription factor n=1 Tax=Gordonia phage Turuncu TaxID=2315610 RepID=A0A386KBK3_9CAUD|nr:transcriptional regulator WhiB-like [Gordonia phage Turuncu]AYD82162.1 WhiB family transcription factor [Gordonia phage Turuncu]